ncbi:hypothetical protein H7H51_26355 [Mycolicibacterium farcinogenes]|nr:hypothetical protein [Mycolicibacterium farcinogenes]
MRRIPALSAPAVAGITRLSAADTVRARLELASTVADCFSVAPQLQRRA